MAVVAATGFFDGVHLGHRLVIKTLCSQAARRGAESLVLSFWPHPRTVLQNGARELRLLNSLEEKVALIKSLGVDRVEILDFTRDFAAMTTEDYLKMLRDRMGVTSILLGYDNTVGSDLLSPRETCALAGELGIEPIMAEALEYEEASISSTRIRKALQQGDVVSAAKMLSYPYQIKGVVVGGQRLGRTIGYPTANLKLYDPLKEIPGNGVYLCQVDTLSQSWWGMTNIGTRPTVSEGGDVSIETHIFGFDQEIYGCDMTLRFVRRIREEKKFSSLDELRLQLCEDEILSRSFMESFPKND